MVIFFSLTFSETGLYAQDEKITASELKKLSVEELMNLEVTLVSRTPQKLTEAASAVQVITGEDIRKSGATNIPEALRLVSNLQVAQPNANAWIISSRGFNTIFANKLLVMIAGRTVYTPLFGGVLWELQNALLEDVDRIEAVSGPGGTLWGVNAVNGVINIITKNSKETRGLYVSALGGT
ncbi:MAG: TonB-dependent receptor plug domain-containing protein, partial [Segetibacter sp.]